MVRFDKPCHSIRHALNYFSVHMATQDYLSEKGELPMMWVGEGAKHLNLPDIVQAEHFEKLSSGTNPFTGERLMVRDKGTNRRVCYFGQISPPKDVSIAYLVGGDERIESWWKEAVIDTIKEIEAVTGTRIRGGGRDENRLTGNMIAAVVTHTTSRSLDPQLHTHLCVMNTTYDQIEKRWKAIQPENYYRYESFFREVCYNKLATRMTEAGYELDQTRPIGFKIKGFSDECRDLFSKRRQEIKNAASELNTKDQDALLAIAATTRTKKKHIDSKELKAGWEREGEAYLPAIRELISQADGHTKIQSYTTALQALKSAAQHHFERSSVVDGRLLLREALIAGRGQVSLEHLRYELNQKINQQEYLQEGHRITSKEMLALELTYIQWVSQGRGHCAPLGIFEKDSSLSAEQQTAVESILSSRNRVIVFQGDAGTGKTTSLRAVIKGVERTGSIVYLAAPSSGATEVLRSDLSAHSETLQQLLVNASLQKKLQGKTLIVDEAGLISSRQMYDLCLMAEQQKCRLLLVGDTKQHASVEAGDALRALQKYAQVEVTRLQEIHRQRYPAYREVVSLLAKGKPIQALTRLDGLGAVHEELNFKRLVQQAAEAYISHQKSGASVLAISPVWSEIHDFTRVVREALKRESLLHGEEKMLTTVHSLSWTQEQKRQLKSYEVGDVLTFHRKTHDFAKHDSVRVVSKNDEFLNVEKADGTQLSFNPNSSKSFDVGLSHDLPVLVGDRLLLKANCKEANLQNGDLVEVSGWNEKGLQLKDGRHVPDYFREFTYGYASTSHASQGKTIDHGILLIGNEALKAANLRQAYVSNSRFRLSQSIFVTNKKAAFTAMLSPSDRLLATELKPVPLQITKPPLISDVDLWHEDQEQNQKIKISL